MFKYSSLRPLLPSTTDVEPPEVIIDSQTETIIQKTLTDIEGLSSISAQGLLTELITNKLNSPYFSALYNFLGLVEGVIPFTYYSGSDMTVGVGLDISAPAHDDAQAVVNSVNPTWDFSQWQTETGQPVPNISPAQLQLMLLYTLIGVTYNGITFLGETPALIAKLGTTLSTTPFEPYQVLALQSLSFNNPVFIGPGIMSALQYMVQNNGDDTQVLLQILEYSNAGLNIGLQNRRLYETGLFHGNPSEVHLTWRQFQRILAANLDMSLPSLIPVWGLPAGNLEASFVGDSAITTFTTGDSVTTMGTPEPDTFSLPDSGNPAIYAGTGDDIMNGLGNSNSSNYPFLAGNVGIDTYWVGTSAGNTMISDEDNAGLLLLDGDTAVQGLGLAQNASSPGEFVLPYGGQNYTLTRTTYSTNTSTINVVQVGWGDPANSVSVANFLGGQFNMALANVPVLIGNFSSIMYPPKSCALATNNVVSLFNFGRQAINALITTQNGEIEADFSVLSLQSGSLYQTLLAGLTGGGFAAGGIEYLVQNNMIINNVTGGTFSNTGQATGFFILQWNNNQGYRTCGTSLFGLSNGEFCLVAAVSSQWMIPACNQLIGQCYNPLGQPTTSVVSIDNEASSTIGSVAAGQMANGNIVIAMQLTGLSYALNAGYICDTSFNPLTHQLTFAGNDVFALSMLNTGFMLIYPYGYGYQQTTNSQTYDFNGQMLTITLSLGACDASTTASVTPLPNSNTLVLFNVGGKVYSQLLSPNNTQVGQLAVLGEGFQSATATFDSGNSYALWTQNTGVTFNLWGSYLETAALQPIPPTPPSFKQPTAQDSSDVSTASQHSGKKPPRRTKQKESFGTSSPSARSRKLLQLDESHQPRYKLAPQTSSAASLSPFSFFRQPVDALAEKAKRILGLKELKVGVKTLEDLSQEEQLPDEIIINELIPIAHAVTLKPTARPDLTPIVPAQINPKLALIIERSQTAPAQDVSQILVFTTTPTATPEVLTAVTRLSEPIHSSSSQSTFDSSKKASVTGVLDLSDRTDTTPVTIDLASQPATLKDAQGKVTEIPQEKNVIVSGAGNHHVKAREYVVTDVRASTGTNLIEVGEGNVVLLGKSADHIVVSETTKTTYVAYFDTHQDILHVRSSTSATDSSIPPVCTDTRHGAAIAVGDNQTVYLYDTRCDELKPDNIKVNDAQSIKEAKAETLQETSLTSTATFAFASSALLTAAPQFITDVLKAKGMSKTNAEWAGRIVHGGLILATGSYILTATSLATQGICEYILEWEHDDAMQAGSVAGVTATIAKNLTPMGVVQTGVGLAFGAAGSFFGRWGARKAVEKLGLQAPREMKEENLTPQVDANTASQKQPQYILHG